MKNKKIRLNELKAGDRVRVTEIYSSYGANEDITKYDCTVEYAEGKMRLVRDGKPFYCGVNSYCEMELIEGITNE